MCIYMYMNCLRMLVIIAKSPHYITEMVLQKVIMGFVVAS